MCKIYTNYLIIMTIQNVTDIEALNNKFLHGNPRLLLEHSINNLFKNKIAYVCSFGTESAIILDLISKIDKDLPIILLNTRFLLRCLEQPFWSLQQTQQKKSHHFYFSYLEAGCWTTGWVAGRLRNNVESLKSNLRWLMF